MIQGNVAALSEPARTGIVPRQRVGSHDCPITGAREVAAKMLAPRNIFCSSAVASIACSGGLARRPQTPRNWLTITAGWSKWCEAPWLSAIPQALCLILTVLMEGVLPRIVVVADRRIGILADPPRSPDALRSSGTYCSLSTCALTNPTSKELS